MQASTPAYQEGTTLETLQAIVADLEPTYGERATKAGTIVAFGSIKLGVSGYVWRVKSETNPKTQDYLVCCSPTCKSWSCGCSDYLYRRESIPGGACKHILAVWILEATNVTHLPQRFYSDEDRFYLTALGEEALRERKA